MLDFHLMTAVKELQEKLENLEKSFNSFKKEIIKNHNELVSYVEEKGHQLDDVELRLVELEGLEYNTDDNREED